MFSCSWKAKYLFIDNINSFHNLKTKVVDFVLKQTNKKKQKPQKAT